MKCPRCHHDNPQGARFCEECVSPLARTVSNCGTPLSATAKFCHACAHPVATGAGTTSRTPDSYTPTHLAEKILTSKTALEGESKQVTVLFADLKGSMELLADRDPEEARKLLDPVLELMMEAVHRYEGTVNQVMGDGVMALSGAPRPRGSRGARVLLGATNAGDREKALGRSSLYGRYSSQDPRWSELRRGGGSLDRQRSANGLLGGGANDSPRRANGATGRCGFDLRHSRYAATSGQSDPGSSARP